MLYKDEWLVAINQNEELLQALESITGPFKEFPRDSFGFVTSDIRPHDFNEACLTSHKAICSYLMKQTLQP